MGVTINDKNLETVVAEIEAKAKPKPAEVKQAKLPPKSKFVQILSDGPESPYIALDMQGRVWVWEKKRKNPYDYDNQTPPEWHWRDLETHETRAV